MYLHECIYMYMYQSTHVHVCVHVRISTISTCTYTSPVTSCRYQGWVKPCNKKA